MSHPDADMNRPFVPEPTKFKNLLENGQTVESFAPMPATMADKSKCYFSTIDHTSFIRKDGKKITFINHFYETKLLFDQQYLDEEIREGNRYVRYATSEETEVAHMRIDPRGTMADKLRNDPAFTQELEDKIRAELVQKIQSGEIVVPLSDTQKLGGTTTGGAQQADTGDGKVKVILEKQPEPVAQNLGLNRLGGIQNSADISKAAAGSGT